MTTEKMTVHKALSEMKTIDDRITKAMGAIPYVLAVKNSAEKINGVTVANFKENMKSGYQKVKDLMARRDAMKRAIVLSNATTKVQNSISFLLLRHSPRIPRCLLTVRL